MKYFLDTEFIEYPCTIDLISIGIVAEDGREFYAISNEFNESKASQWVKENVISKLPSSQFYQHTSPNLREEALFWMSRKRIKEQILEFIGQDKPSFWGYYADYDWVIFCWLFGTMMELPKVFPMYCNDIKQLCNSLGNPQLPKMEGQDHNALDDAKHHKKCYEFLINSPQPPKLV